MPFDCESKPQAKADEGEGIPIGYAFAAALLAQSGPCSHSACPIPDSELWRPGKCMLDGCPRQTAYQRQTQASP